MVQLVALARRHAIVAGAEEDERGRLGAVDRGEALMPRLKDSILTEFQGLYAMRLITDQGFDTPLVRKRIKVASERVLGSGVVTGIDLIIAPKRKPSKA